MPNFDVAAVDGLIFPARDEYTYTVDCVVSQAQLLQRNQPRNKGSEDPRGGNNKAFEKTCATQKT